MMNLSLARCFMALVIAGLMFASQTHAQMVWKSGSTIFVYGTNGADTIEIYSQSVNNAPPTLHVIVHGTDAGLASQLSSVDRVIVYSFNGNDGIYASWLQDLSSIDLAVYSGSGNDTIRCGTCGTAFVNAGSGHDTIHGTDGDDDLTGGSGNDRIYGYDGDDWMWGGQGNDRIYGYNGDDVMYGEQGNDLLYGHNGDDHLDGGDGYDSLYGHAGIDLLAPGSGESEGKVFGSGGVDHFYMNPSTVYAHDYTYRVDLLFNP